MLLSPVCVYVCYKGTNGTERGWGILFDIILIFQYLETLK